MTEDEKALLEKLKKEFGDLEPEELLKILKNNIESLKRENKHLKTKRDLLKARDTELQEDEEEMAFEQFIIRVIDKE